MATLVIRLVSNLQRFIRSWITTTCIYRIFDICDQKLGKFRDLTIHGQKSISLLWNDYEPEPPKPLHIHVFLGYSWCPRSKMLLKLPGSPGSLDPIYALRANFKVDQTDSKLMAFNRSWRDKRSGAKIIADIDCNKRYSEKRFRLTRHLLGGGALNAPTFSAEL